MILYNILDISGKLYENSNIHEEWEQKEENIINVLKDFPSLNDNKIQSFINRYMKKNDIINKYRMKTTLNGDTIKIKNEIIFEKLFENNISFKIKFLEDLGYKYLYKIENNEIRNFLFSAINYSKYNLYIEILEDFLNDNTNKIKEEKLNQCGYGNLINSKTEIENELNLLDEEILNNKKYFNNFVNIEYFKYLNDKNKNNKKKIIEMRTNMKLNDKVEDFNFGY